ncbi:DUF1697 domain-containing protein [Tabrizicola sp.]|uniref:DUF1697 domain-containing protein n=1 Tax=Tabrizicola sp. TaxID=2005166 RepID=UPI00286C14A0|nr:DUF1697 domain-containing protein [Tabrizicola sp.]
MPARLALLRGVNVSGANKLPMAEFRALLTGLGLHRVETYIQNGNAVFDSDLAAQDLARVISDGIGAAFGFAPAVLVLDATELSDALNDHPFTGAAPEKVHVFFLQTAPDALDEDALRRLAAPGDGWHLSGRRFTLHTPGGVGASRLAAKLPSLLPVPMTARNLRTVAALCTMVAARG